MRELNTQVMLRVIDTRWMNYLQEMDYLKTGIGLRGFGQRDPLVEYKTEAYGAFQMLVDTMYEDYLRTVLRIEIKAAPHAVEHKEDPALEGAHFSGPADVDGDNGNSVLRKQAQVQARTAVQGGPAAVNNGGKVTTYRKSESDDPYVNVGRNDLCPAAAARSQVLPRQESLMAEALEVTPAELDAFADRLGEVESYLLLDEKRTRVAELEAKSVALAFGMTPTPLAPPWRRLLAPRKISLPWIPRAASYLTPVRRWSLPRRWATTPMPPHCARRLPLRQNAWPAQSTISSFRAGLPVSSITATRL